MPHVNAARACERGARRARARDPDLIPLPPGPQVKNGRLAMLAFIGFCSQAAVRGMGPIDCLKMHMDDPWHNNSEWTSRLGSPCFSQSNLFSFFCYFCAFQRVFSPPFAGM